MRIITGWLTAACFAGLAVKWILRKLGLHKANALLMKLHEPVSGAMFLLAIAHGILALVKLYSVSLTTVCTGSIAFAVSVLLIAACHMTKDPVKKMRDHRWLSLLLLIAIVTHIGMQSLT